MRAERFLLTGLLVCIVLTLSACTPQQTAEMKEIEAHQKDVLVTFTTPQPEQPKMINTFSSSEMTRIVNPYFSVQNSTGEIFRVDHEGNFYLYPLINCDTLDTDANGLLSCGTDTEGVESLSSADDYITVDTPTGAVEINFNESKLEVTYYNATSINVVTGTGAGALLNIQSYNQLAYNVTEDTSDYELLVNFTGIDDFTTLLVRHKSDLNTDHVAVIEIWDYDSSSWEGYGYLTERTTSEMKTLGVYDADEHIQDGIVQVRFYQDESPPPTTHIHQFDWVALSKGFGTPVGQEIDPIWTSDKSDYSTTAQANNLYTNDTDTDTNLTGANIVSFVGNWSADKTDYSTTAEANLLYRLESWDNITGIPVATPSDDDTTHLSTADQIFDYIASLSYATTTYADSLGNWTADKGDYSTTAEAGALYAAFNYNPFDQVLNTTSDVQFNDATVNSIILDGDIANHKIYDNSSCIIIQAGTTYLEICE